MVSFVYVPELRTHALMNASPLLPLIEGSYLTEDSTVLQRGRFTPAKCLLLAVGGYTEAI